MKLRKKDSLLSQGMTTYLLKFCSFIGDKVADKTPLQKTKLVILSEAKKLLLFYLTLKNANHPQPLLKNEGRKYRITALAH